MATQKKMLTTKETAEQLGIDPKALRVFLRTAQGAALVERDGKAKYAIPASNVSKIKAGLAAHTKAAEARKAAKAAQEAAEPDLEPQDNEDTTPEDDELEEVGDDEELEEDDE